MEFLRNMRAVCTVMFAPRSFALPVMLIVSLLLSSSFVFAQDTGGSSPSAGGKVFLPFLMSGRSPASEAVSVDRTNQVIVRFRDSVSAAAADRAAQTLDLSDAAGVSLQHVREMSGGATVFRLPSWMSVDEVRTIADLLLSVADVEYAEPDSMMNIMATPTDPRYGDQWHYFAPTAGNYGANLPAAWDITTGSNSVVVAVIDTGILSHVDLNGRTVHGYDFIADSLVANDGNGRDNNPSDPGDWITSAEAASGYFAGCQVRNSSWHGSHVAGTIAANSNNGQGGAGINWNARIQAVRVLGKCGGYTSDIVDGIRWAAGLPISSVPANATPADVINMSLGGSGACSSTYQNAINDAINAGTVVVVAAGNSTANAANYSPASCSGVITVASTGKAGNLAYYSNFGATVEIAAPGGDRLADNSLTVLSTINSGTTTPVTGGDVWAYYQGTSMASPHVAGVVSLMFSVNPSLTPAQVTTLLQQNVTAFPSGSTCNTSNCGAGILNAAAAVAAAQAAAGQPPAAFNKSNPANGGSVSGTSTTISWAASAGATSYAYCVDTTNDNACSNWTNAGSSTSATITGLVAGTTYYWQVRASNIIGTVEANAGAWWSFGVTAAPPPGTFSKSSPANGATRVRTSTTLRWNASSGATSYQYCVYLTSGGTCTWSNATTATQVSISGLASRQNYTWQVRANNASGFTLANGGSTWTFTTR